LWPKLQSILKGPGNGTQSANSRIGLEPEFVRGLAAPTGKKKKNNYGHFRRRERRFFRKPKPGFRGSRQLTFGNSRAAFLEPGVRSGSSRARGGEGEFGAAPIGQFRSRGKSLVSEIRMWPRRDRYRSESHGGLRRPVSFFEKWFNRGGTGRGPSGLKNSSADSVPPPPTHQSWDPEHTGSCIEPECLFRRIYTAEEKGTGTGADFRGRRGALVCRL